MYIIQTESDAKKLIAKLLLSDAFKFESQKHVKDFANLLTSGSLIILDFDKCLDKVSVSRGFDIFLAYKDTVYNNNTSLKVNRVLKRFTWLNVKKMISSKKEVSVVIDVGQLYAFYKDFESKEELKNIILIKNFKIKNGELLANSIMINPHAEGWPINLFFR